MDSKDTRNFAVSPTALSLFLDDVQGYSEMPLAASQMSFADVVKLRQEAVFFIELYSNTRYRPAVDSTISPKSPSDDPMVKFRLFADHSCILCTSKGYIGCRNCSGGFVTVRKTVQVATSVTGEAIMGTKNFKTRCSRCMRGRIKCPGCGGTGRIK